MEQGGEWRARVAHSIGKQVHHWRDRRKLSAQQLSAEIDRLGGSLPRGVIAKLESGSRNVVSVDEWLLLAEALEVPPLQLLVPLDDGPVELRPDRRVNPWTAVRHVAGLGTPEMELLAEYEAEKRNLRTLLRASMNRGGTLMDVPQLQMARNSYRALLHLQQRMVDQGFAEPELDADLSEWIAKPGFTDAIRS